MVDADEVELPEEADELIPLPAGEFDASRAMLREPDWFPRFRVPEQGERMAEARVSPKSPIIVVERGGESRALLIKQLIYHHVAEGELGGEPFAVAFCIICHSGVGLVPIVDGRRLHLSTGGVYDGMSILIDDETRTYWDHIRGRGLHGPLMGAVMPTFNVRVTNVATAMAANPNLTLSRSSPGIAARLFSQFGMFGVRGRGFLPPGMGSTMGERDRRLPTMSEGLGVVVGQHARFYPLKLLEREGTVEDRWGRRRVRVRVRAEDGIPEAVWKNDESAPRPLQLFTRWYAWSFSYPHCPIYGDPASGYL